MNSVLKRRSSAAAAAKASPGPANLLERLRARGWQLTPQRRVVAEVLAGEHVHLSSDEILQQAQLRLPEISRATVYKTLAEMVEFGEINEVSLGTRAKRYDPNVGAHHHLLCESCGLVRDVSPRDRNPRLRNEQRHGFVVSGVDIVFRGLCRDCAKGQRKRRPDTAT